MFDTTEALRFGAPLLRKVTGAACPGQWYGPGSVNVSPCGRKCVYVGSNEFNVTVATTDMLDEVLKVDVTTGLKIESDDAFDL